jgi:hypothetical protein
MKRFLTVLVLAFLLAGCLPAVNPTIFRADSEVTVTISPVRALFDVNIVILGASTSDFRCVAFEEDLGCELGALPAFSTTRILVTPNDPGEREVYCVLYGFLDSNRTSWSYRAFPCSPR